MSNTESKRIAGIRAINKSLRAKGYSAKAAYAMAPKMYDAKLSAEN